MAQNIDTRRSTPELIREAEEAHRNTDLTIGLGEEILDRVKEVAQHIEDRVRHAGVNGTEARIAEMT